MDPPWSLRFASGAPLTLATMLRGQAWVVPADGEPVPIGTGDIAIIRGPAPYTVADDPATPPHAGDHQRRLLRPDRRPEGDEHTSGPRGPADVSRTARPCCSAAPTTRRGGISERLLQALPDVLVVPADDCHYPMLDLVAEEVTRERAGAAGGARPAAGPDARLHAAGLVRPPEAHAPGLVPRDGRPGRRPRAAAAPRQTRPTPGPWRTWRPRCGASRAALARRFTAQVGEPPMAYLAGWRIALAADLLRETDATVGTIARKVGYANAFALSVAFKRRRGITPTEHRAAATCRPASDKRVTQQGVGLAGAAVAVDRLVVDAFQLDGFAASGAWMMLPLPT